MAPETTPLNGGSGKSTTPKTTQNRCYPTDSAADATTDDGAGNGHYLPFHHAEAFCEGSGPLSVRWGWQCLTCDREEYVANLAAAEAGAAAHIDQPDAAKDQSCECPALRQVGWMGPYGVIPGGMDNDPVPGWQPLYVRQEARNE